MFDWVVNTLLRLIFPLDTVSRFNVDTTLYDVASTLKRRFVSKGLVASFYEIV